MKPTVKTNANESKEPPKAGPKGFLKSFLRRESGRKDSKKMGKVLDSIKGADDNSLVEEYLASGCQKSLAELYERYSAKILGTCFTILRDREEARDAMMEVFEKIMVNLPKARPQHFATWVYSITRNHCLSYVRKQGKYTVVDFNDPNYRLLEDFDQRVEPELLAQLPETVIAAAMEDLPEKQLASIRYFYFEEKSYVEIAKLLNCEPKEVKSHLQNGRRNLGIRLQGWYAQQKGA